ncbi:MAG: amidohydrolase [Deltaproteobacteria bacterium]|nr:amidohydrolase [Deltaproteobacteria bacterium]
MAREERSADLMISGGMVLTMNNKHEIIEKGAVAIKGNRILAVGRAAELQETVAAGALLEAANCLIMPGLINLHTHAPMVLFRGLADDLPLQTWLQEHIFPAEAAYINEESVYWGTLLAIVEMIRGGTTTFCDGYFCVDGAARALLAGGIRGVLSQGVIDLPAPGVPDPSRNLQVAESFLRRWQGVSSRLAPGLFCHSTSTCATETLRDAKSLCREAGLLLQIHLAETRTEVEETEKRHGFRPVYLLHKLGILDSSTLCHHSVWLTEEEVDVLASSGVGVSHNPESNMKLASGVAPLPRLLAAGVKVGLGTDGSASNNDLDMFGEMDNAAKLHKVWHGDPALCPAMEVVQMATCKGAAALGMAVEIGSLEEGKLADIITIDLEQPHLTPLYEPCSHLVYSARGSDVRDVIVDGTVLMRERQLLSLDEEEAMARVRQIAARIKTP